MKVQIFIVFSVVILLETISICDGTCFTECKDALPKRIQKWKRKDYGLEIPDTITLDTNLKGLDASTQEQATKDGRLITMYQIDKLIKRNNKGNQKKNPDFTINKLDPISYKYQDMNMLITFSNVRLTNLDGYAYDTESAKYNQIGVYEKGSQEIDEKTFNEIKALLKEKENETLRKFYERIKTGADGEHILARRDCKWTIEVGARFITKQDKIEKPIIIEAEFKIQPEKPINNSETKTSEEPLRAKGVVKMEFHDFQFNLILDITHIDDPLRPFLDPKLRTDNLVPDFDVTYSMSNIKIQEIKLLKYDKDDDFPIKPDEEEDVNENLPPEVDAKKKSSKDSKPVNKKDQFVTNDKLKNDVQLHFTALANLVQNNPLEIKKKLCANLLPKMAFKVMHMQTKKQLPSLFYEIIAYEDGFQEKLKLPPFNLSDWMKLLADYAVAKAKEATKNAFGWIMPRSKSAPPSMSTLEKKDEKK